MTRKYLSGAHGVKRWQAEEQSTHEAGKWGRKLFIELKKIKRENAKSSEYENPKGQNSENKTLILDQNSHRT